MFNFFRPKVKIDSVSIPDFGWGIQKDEPSVKLWVNDARTVALSLNFFNQKPDLPTLKNMDAVRTFYRNLAVQANGGLIEVSLIELKGFAAVKTILKIPMVPKGTTYLASLTIPFRDCSFVVKVQANDVEGLRSTLVLDQLMESGVVKLGKGGLQGWACDPYDAGFVGGSLMNLSEGEGYDARFLGEGLSEARRLIGVVALEIMFKEDLRRVIPML